jgi:Tfp pilus assembly protein PilF
VLTESGNQFVEALTRGELARSLSALGDTAAAAVELTAAAMLYRALDDQPSVTRILLDLATLHLTEGDHARARQAFDEAKALRARSPEPRDGHRLAEIAASLEAAEQRVHARQSAAH